MLSAQKCQKKERDFLNFISGNRILQNEFIFQNENRSKTCRKLKKTTLLVKIDFFFLRFKEIFDFIIYIIKIRTQGNSKSKRNDPFVKIHKMKIENLFEEKIKRERGGESPSGWQNQIAQIIRIIQK